MAQHQGIAQRGGIGRFWRGDGIDLQQIGIMRRIAHAAGRVSHRDGHVDPCLPRLPGSDGQPPVLYRCRECVGRIGVEAGGKTPGFVPGVVEHPVEVAGIACAHCEGGVRKELQALESRIHRHRKCQFGALPGAIADLDGHGFGPGLETADHQGAAAYFGSQLAAARRQVAEPQPAGRIIDDQGV